MRWWWFTLPGSACKLKHFFELGRKKKRRKTNETNSMKWSLYLGPHLTSASRVLWFISIWVVPFAKWTASIFFDTITISFFTRFCLNCTFHLSVSLFQNVYDMITIIIIIETKNCCLNLVCVCFENTAIQLNGLFMSIVLFLAPQDFGYLFFLPQNFYFVILLLVHFADCPFLHCW